MHKEMKIRSMYRLFTSKLLLLIVFVHASDICFDKTHSYAKWQLGHTLQNGGNLD